MASTSGFDPPDRPSPDASQTTIASEVTTTATGLATAEAFLGALTMLDADRLGELLTSDPVINDNLGLVNSAADYAPLFDWYRALDWEFTGGTCTATADRDIAVVLCNYTEWSALARGLGLVPAPGTLTLRVGGDGIEQIEYARSPIQGWGEFRAWVLRSHADEVDVMYLRDTNPRLSAEATLRWDRYVYEWLVSTAGSGPITSFDVIAGTTFVPLDPDIASAFHFFPAGRWYIGYSVDFVSQAPSGIVIARFEDTTVFLTNVRGACEGPAEASYEIHLLENGNLDLVLIDDPCLFRANFFPGEWAPVF